jgi:hypothetical protein
VNAFWSVTMYDGKSQLLIKNPINRYLLNSPMLPEGSITLYIRKDSPGADKESNWLPPRQMTPSTSSCASTGRRAKRPRSCRPATVPGNRRASWR